MKTKGRENKKEEGNKRGINKYICLVWLQPTIELLCSNFLVYDLCVFSFFLVSLFCFSASSPSSCFCYSPHVFPSSLSLYSSASLTWKQKKQNKERKRKEKQQQQQQHTANNNKTSNNKTNNNKASSNHNNKEKTATTKQKQRKNWAKQKQDPQKRVTKLPPNCSRLKSRAENRAPPKTLLNYKNRHSRR